MCIRDRLEEVPIDSARFLFNMHDAGSGIDFDLDQAVKTDNDHPVSVSYTHLASSSVPSSVFFLFTVPYLAAYCALRYMIAPSSAL